MKIKLFIQNKSFFILIEIKLKFGPANILKFNSNP